MDKQTSINYLVYQLESLFTNVLVANYPNHRGTGYTQITFTHDKIPGIIKFFNPEFIKVNTNNDLYTVYDSVSQVVEELKGLTLTHN
jgi:hypothetical protein